MRRMSERAYDALSPQDATASMRRMSPGVIGGRARTDHHPYPVSGRDGQRIGPLVRGNAGDHAPLWRARLSARHARLSRATGLPAAQRQHAMPPHWHPTVSSRAEGRINRGFRLNDRVTINHQQADLWRPEAPRGHPFGVSAQLLAPVIRLANSLP